MRTLRLVVSRETPKTWGEGFVEGSADGYARGRADCGLERLAIGILVGLIVGFGLVVVLR